MSVPHQAECCGGVQPSRCGRGERRSLEQYKVRKQLYKGAISCVFEAVDRRTGAHIALKVYKKVLMEEPERTQLEREMAIHSRLNHKNIIKLATAFEDDTAVYLAQAFAKGGDLFNALAGCGRFDENRAAGEVIAPLLDALDYIHSKGVIHRDIKTENILFDADGTLKLADFGLAIDSTTARPGTRLGTWEYMAPEIHLCPYMGEKSTTQETYSASVDTWAVGVLTYELLVGRTPFQTRDGEMTREELLRMEPMMPSGLSPAAASFIRSALCKDPKRRPTASQLLKHRWLQPFIKNQNQNQASQLGVEVLIRTSSATAAPPPRPSLLDLDATLQPSTPSQLQLPLCPGSPTKQAPAASAVATAAARLQHKPPSRVYSSALLGSKYEIDHWQPVPPRSNLSQASSGAQRTGPSGAAGYAAAPGPSGKEGGVTLLLPALTLHNRTGSTGSQGLDSVLDAASLVLQRVSSTLDLQASPPHSVASRGLRASIDTVGSSGKAQRSIETWGQRSSAASSRTWNQGLSQPPSPLSSCRLGGAQSPSLLDGLLEVASPSSAMVLPSLPLSAMVLPSLPLSRMTPMPLPPAPLDSMSQPLPSGPRTLRSASAQLLALQSAQNEYALMMENVVISEVPWVDTGPRPRPQLDPALPPTVSMQQPPAAARGSEALQLGPTQRFAAQPARGANNSVAARPKEEAQRGSSSPSHESGSSQSKVKALYSLGKALLSKLAKHDE